MLYSLTRLQNEGSPPYIRSAHYSICLPPALLLLTILPSSPNERSLHKDRFQNYEPISMTYGLPLQRRNDIQNQTQNHEAQNHESGPITSTGIAKLRNPKLQDPDTQHHVANQPRLLAFLATRRRPRLRPTPKPTRPKPTRLYSICRAVKQPYTSLISIFPIRPLSCDARGVLSRS